VVPPALVALVAWFTFVLIFWPNSVERAIEIAVVNALLLKAFEDHLLRAEHRLAEMSATPEAMEALAKKIQTRSQETADNTVYGNQFICNTNFSN